MKLVIKSPKSRQLHTGAPLPALNIPCGKERISQCQRKKNLVNGQRTESVNTAEEQTPLGCREHLRSRVLQGQGGENHCSGSSQEQQVLEGEVVGGDGFNPNTTCATAVLAPTKWPT